MALGPLLPFSTVGLAGKKEKERLGAPPLPPHFLQRRYSEESDGVRRTVHNVWQAGKLAGPTRGRRGQPRNTPAAEAAAGAGGGVGGRPVVESLSRAVGSHSPRVSLGEGAAGGVPSPDRHTLGGRLKTRGSRGEGDAKRGRASVGAVCEERAACAVEGGFPLREAVDSREGRSFKSRAGNPPLRCLPKKKAERWRPTLPWLGWRAPQSRLPAPSSSRTKPLGQREPVEGRGLRGDGERLFSSVPRGSAALWRRTQTLLPLPRPPPPPPPALWRSHFYESTENGLFLLPPVFLTPERGGGPYSSERGGGGRFTAARPVVDGAVSICALQAAGRLLNSLCLSSAAQWMEAETM